MDDCLSVCNQIRAVAARLERDLNESLSGLDVSHCQSLILMRTAEEPVCMLALSKILCCHKSNVTQVVDGLVKKGLIERIPSEIDRRMCELRLTSRGKRMIGGLTEVLCGRAGECMCMFTTTEKNLLSDLLGKYMKRKEEVA